MRAATAMNRAGDRVNPPSAPTYRTLRRSRSAGLGEAARPPCLLYGSCDARSIPGTFEPVREHVGKTLT